MTRGSEEVCFKCVLLQREAQDCIAAVGKEEQRALEWSVLACLELGQQQRWDGLSLPAHSLGLLDQWTFICEVSLIVAARWRKENTSFLYLQLNKWPCYG